MASLVLLISELLKHESIDTLLSSPAGSSSSSSSSAAQSCAAMVARNSLAYGYNMDSKNSSRGFNGASFKTEELEEELPRICVDLVWP